MARIRHPNAYQAPRKQTVPNPAESQVTASRNLQRPKSVVLRTRPGLQAGSPPSAALTLALAQFGLTWAGQEPARSPDSVQAVAPSTGTKGNE